MFEVRTNQHGTKKTYFDISSFIEPRDLTIEGLSDLVMSNGALFDLSRIRPSIYTIDDVVVVFRSGYGTYEPTPFALKWTRILVHEILKLRPKHTGGRDVSQTLEQFLGPTKFEEFCSDAKLSEDQKRTLATAALFAGKIFKSHMDWYYESGVREMLDLLWLALVEYNDKDVLFVVDHGHAVLEGTRIFQSALFAAIIQKFSNNQLNSYPLPHHRTKSSKRKIDSPQLRAEATRIWSEILGRSPERVVEAARKSLLVDRYASRRTTDDLGDYLDALEHLSAEMIDELTTDGPAADLGPPQQIPGVDGFEISPTGLQFRTPSNAPIRKRGELVAKHELALAALGDLHSHIGNLDNTTYKSFVRFIPVLQRGRVPGRGVGV